MSKSSAALAHNNGDRWQALRYCVVGCSIAGLYVLLYAGLTAGGYAPMAANAWAFGLAVIFQYIAQTVWTFRRPLGLPDQMLRFVCTIALGFLTSAVLTSGVAPLVGLSAWSSAAVVAVWLPVQNYLFFRIWVYAPSSV